MLGTRIRRIPRWGWIWMLLAAAFLGVEIFRAKPVGIAVASALLVLGFVGSVWWRPRPRPESLPPAPGWYPAGPGLVRWWDGSRWTDAQLVQPSYVCLGLPAPGDVPPGLTTQHPQPWYRRQAVWVGVAAVVVLASVAGIALYGHHLNTTPHTVGFRVTGDSGTADVTETYTDSYGHTHSLTTTNATLPWQSTVAIKGDSSTYRLHANGPAGTVMTCTITVDGHLAAEQTSATHAPAVHCTGTP